MRTSSAPLARIVLTSFGSLGDVYPYIGIGRELRVRGHDVVLAMPPCYRTVVEGAGLTFAPVRPDLDPTDPTLVARIMDANSGTSFIVRDLLLASLPDSFADLRAACREADLLVTHPVTFAAPLVAEHLGLRWVSTVLAPMSFFSPRDLPVFPQMPWAKRLDKVPGVARALVALARAATRRWGEPVHALRRELGLAPGGHPLFEGQHSPHLALGLYPAVLGALPPDAPRAARVTGGIAYNGSADGASLPPPLEAFLAQGPAPVVFTLGSSAVEAAGSFYEESADAARRLGKRAVLLVGARGMQGGDALEEDGVLRVAFAAHAALFPRAAAIVHQGGAGTLHQALRSGRPMLVVPFAHDQPDNAYRAARLGCAKVLRPTRYTGPAAAVVLGELLHDPAYVRRASAVGHTVREERGVARACAAIEAMLSPSGPRR